ncbi:MAG: asparagine synthase (glutamine-hydrolyzing) [Deltaproteobacteria bacterium]|nr:asparagine synthase (glutamine-hydrolyzing) [Deltaproteobacteria bacterium]
MCGIAGLFRPHVAATTEDVAAVQRMLRAQIHRGPDGEGLLAPTSQVVFGHRRLAIIDRSEAGQQPMSNEDGTVWITYNGEIYNFAALRAELTQRGHTFRSGTDTEVIVHGYEEWGIDGVLARLQGMFAFALYDARPRPGQGEATGGQLILARDRMGIKPLYYARLGNGEGLIFASEVKALRASGMVSEDRDRDALAGFLLLGSIPAPRTMLRHVASLPAGQYLMVHDGEPRCHTYWNPSIPRGDCAPPLSLVELGHLLEASTARHLLSQVPLGVFLSGGVDSAGLVALACRAQSAPVRTLTVGYGEEDGGESRAARTMAAHFQTDHREVFVRESDFLRELPNIFAALDQPTNDGVNTYFVAQAARATGLTVALSGLGADEVFWGYRHYRWLAKQPSRWLTMLPSFFRQALANGVSAYGGFVGQERWQRFAYLNGGPTGRELYLLIRGFFAPAQIQQLLGLSANAREAMVEQVVPHGESQDEQQRFNDIEMRRYLHDQLLRDADVLGMTHSIEVRVPYLDHTVVEAVRRMAASDKMDPRENKPVLVRALGDEMVRKASQQPKRGFTVPMQSWMLRYADELESLALRATSVDREAVRVLWRQFRAGRLHWSRAWALTVLGAIG